MQFSVTPSWITFSAFAALVAVPGVIPFLLVNSTKEATFKYVAIASIAFCMAVLVGTLWPMASGKVNITPSDIVIRAFYRTYRIDFSEILSVDVITRDSITSGIRTNGISLGQYHAGNFRINNRPAVMLINNSNIVKIKTATRDYYLSATGAAEKLRSHIASAAQIARDTAPQR
jgi:hypothetical protein